MIKLKTGSMIASGVLLAGLLNPNPMPLWAAPAAYVVPESDMDLEEVSEEEAARAQAWFLRGEDLFRKGYLPEALDAYTKSLLLDPMQGAVYGHRADLYIRLGEDEHRQATDEVLTGKALEYYENAARDYAEAVALDPGDLQDHLGLAVTLTALDRFEEACWAFDTVLRAKPDNYAVYDARARLFIDSGDYEKALADLDKALDLNPRDRMNNYYRGILCAKQGDYPAAIGYFDQEPQMALTWLQKARVYERMGKNSEALDCYLEFRSRDKVGNSYTRAFTEERIRNIRVRDCVGTRS